MVSWTFVYGKHTFTIFNYRQALVTPQHHDYALHVCVKPNHDLKLGGWGISQTVHTIRKCQLSCCIWFQSRPLTLLLLCPPVDDRSRGERTFVCRITHNTERSFFSSVNISLRRATDGSDALRTQVAPVEHIDRAESHPPKKTSIIVRISSLFLSHFFFSDS